jgi:pimeloyl-ACP methyl ester carboxylesterase
MMRCQLTLLLLFITLLAAGPPRLALAQGVATGDTIQVGDMDMYYEVLGTGEPLLLLHPFNGCGAIWKSFTGALEEHYQLIIPDLRGHGRSTNPAGTFTHRQVATDLLGLLDVLGIGEVMAMGISSGGMALLHMATQQRDRLKAMVLIGATTYYPDQARAVMRTYTPDEIPREVMDQFLPCASRGEEQVRELVTQFLEFQHSYDDMTFTVPHLATISARTLIVHGDRDAFFPVDIPVEMYRSIPTAALWIVPGGGHVPIFDPLVPFTDVALRFLEGRTPR